MSVQTRDVKTTDPHHGGLPRVLATPYGFDPRPCRGFVAIHDSPRLRVPPSLRTALNHAIGSDPTTWNWWWRGRPFAPGRLPSLRHCVGVVDHPDLHRTENDRVHLLANLLAAGVPVVVTDPGRMDSLLGRDLGDALRRLAPGELTDPTTRESISVSLRREALRRFGPPTKTVAGTVPRRAKGVSAICATIRPEQVDHVIEQMNRQRHPNLERVVALHGEAFPADAEQYVGRCLRSPCTVIREPSERSFGDVLNAASSAASGDLLTKMDDDDDYGPHHCLDLTLAWQYSGATLVGKGAEFIHLAALGMTLRRFSFKAERWHDLVAGSTLLLSRDDLDHVGGWASAPRRVDRLLVEAVQQAGGRVYRTHGFEYLVHRHHQRHTWEAESGYFLRQSDQQWRNVPTSVIGL